MKEPTLNRMTSLGSPIIGGAIFGTGKQAKAFVRKWETAYRKITMYCLDDVLYVCANRGDSIPKPIELWMTTKHDYPFVPYLYGEDKRRVLFLSRKKKRKSKLLAHEEVYYG